MSSFLPATVSHSYKFITASMCIQYYMSSCCKSSYHLALLTVFLCGLHPLVSYNMCAYILYGTALQAEANPVPKFGIIIPIVPFGMPEYDGGERFDLRCELFCKPDLQLL